MPLNRSLSSFQRRKNSVLELHAWCDVSEALQQYARTPTRENAYNLEASAHALRMVKEREAALIRWLAPQEDKKPMDAEMIASATMSASKPNASRQTS